MFHAALVCPLLLWLRLIMTKSGSLLLYKYRSVIIHQVLFTVYVHKVKILVTLQFLPPASSENITIPRSC